MAHPLAPTDLIWAAQLAPAARGERDVATALLRGAEATGDPVQAARLLGAALAATERAEQLHSLALSAGGLGAVVLDAPSELPSDPSALVDLLADQHVALAASPASLQERLVAQQAQLGGWLAGHRRGLPDDWLALLTSLTGSADAARAALRRARWRRLWARVKAGSERIGQLITALLLGSVYLVGGLLVGGRARRELGRERR